MKPSLQAATDTIGWAKPDDVGMSRERLQRIGDVLERDIDRGLLPGAVALVARRGRIVHFKAYGRRDPASPDPMALDSIFRIYSMTKPIVSVAAMMLTEEGRLGLADPVSAYLPGFGQAGICRGETDGKPDCVPLSRPVTIQDLLRHTSGLTYEWMDEAGIVGELYRAAGMGRRDITGAAVGEALAGLPLVAEPGTRWIYSRSTDVLGRVIEVVAGRPLGEHLDEVLFGPLGMMETGFHLPEAFLPRMAEPHPVDPDTGEPVTLLDPRKPAIFESGGGGLLSTASDYARFLHMLSSGGTLDGARLLSPATIGFMLSDHLGPEVVVESDLLPAGHGFGLGFAIRRARGVAPFPGSVGDAWWQGIGGTSFWIDPAAQLYGLLMIQAPGRRNHYRELMRHLVYGALTE